MKKKIEIISLSLILFVATTGIPMYYHYCQMIEQTSMNGCLVCNIETNEEQSSCCSENTFDQRNKISSSTSDCCQVNFVYLNVDDQFLLNKTEIQVQLVKIIDLPALNEEVSNNLVSSNKSFNSDPSPPFLIDPELYLTNSVLLI
ncbi:hypothetical protein [Ignavibacterium album]|nr:hypothetical protein [Ignavibacterium album]